MLLKEILPEKIIFDIMNLLSYGNLMRFGLLQVLTYETA